MPKWERRICVCRLSGKRLDLFAAGSLTFEKPDLKTFRGLALAFRAMEQGGNMPTVFNAANEKAVAMFLKEQISYPAIPEIIEASMEEIPFAADPKLEEILETEAAVYQYIESRW